MNLQGHKVQKLAEQKNLSLGNKPKNSFKVGFFGFCQKFNPLMFLFYLKYGAY